MGRNREAISRHIILYEPDKDGYRMPEVRKKDFQTNRHCSDNISCKVSV